MGAAQTGTGKTAGFTLPHPAVARAAGQHQPVAGAAPDARADPHADARARGPGRGKRAHLRQVPAAAHDGGLRRRGHRPADQGAARRRGDPGRHARPPARSPAPEDASTCRASKSWCSTKPTACSTWASCPTSSASSRCCPQQRQNLLFSATFPDEVRRLAKELLRSPVTIEVAPRNAPADLVTHQVYLVPLPDASARCSSTSSARATCGRCWFSCG